MHVPTTTSASPLVIDVVVEVSLSYQSFNLILEDHTFLCCVTIGVVELAFFVFVCVRWGLLLPGVREVFDQIYGADLPDDSFPSHIERGVVVVLRMRSGMRPLSLVVVLFSAISSFPFLVGLFSLFVCGFSFLPFGLSRFSELFHLHVSDRSFSKFGHGLWLSDSYLICELPWFHTKTTRVVEEPHRLQHRHMSGGIACAIIWTESGYDGSMAEWEEYPRYVSPYGLEVPPLGVYGDLYHHGYSYAPYSPYPTPRSPVPALGHNNQLYGSQHYQPATYYQPPTPTGAPNTKNQMTSSKGDVSTFVAVDLPSVSVDTTKANSNGVAKSIINSNNELAKSKPSEQNGPSNVGGTLAGGVSSSSYQDPRFGFDDGMSIDGKYKPRGRGNGFFGYVNENMDGLGELNKGPRSEHFRNQKGFGSTITLAVRGQSLPINVNIQDSAAAPDRDQYNKTDFSETYADAKFFIIKSYSEDDIHKSIKYSVWASTPHGNKKLDAAYQESKDKSTGCPAFLFFSISINIISYIPFIF
ncbi:hypothetical protein Cni_G16699 [Canna indica]|uniref:YTH domain-containing family protein n=1 Tax=Canna indica TaxID=4628 RepID=A0AAQ3QEF6_9LILI|nr:hypothetical protein Cni_G16699 [Canna indica]